MDWMITTKKYVVIIYHTVVLWSSSSDYNTTIQSSADFVVHTSGYTYVANNILYIATYI